MSKKQRNLNNFDSTTSDSTNQKVKNNNSNAYNKNSKDRCMCLSNVPGYPYRLGYHKMYVDINNDVRCVYCDCYCDDPRKNESKPKQPVGKK